MKYSLICDRLGINVWEVIDLANRHPRVKILRPGPGVGGHCIAVDPWFIVNSAPDIAKLIRTSREINDGKIDYVFRRAVEVIEEHPYASVACCGLAFKANVDDLREVLHFRLHEIFVPDMAPALNWSSQISRNFPIQSRNMGRV